ncbi:MAG TPA: hypothetical protein VG496_01945, partial [Myxococcales bacterium]|nr:hypothetical protein [Myxococcales bacterium]
MANDNGKGGNGMAMLEPPPLAIEDLPQIDPSLMAGARGSGGHRGRRRNGATAPLLFGDGVAAARGAAGSDRVLLVGLVWGKETLIELQQVPVGGSLRAAKLSNLP